MKAGELEVSFKRENSIYLPALNQYKRDTIGKTDLLIRIFAKELQCLDFIFPIGSVYGEGLRGIDVFCPLNSEAVSGLTSQ